MSDLLIGRRAVYTRITKEYDAERKEMVEVKRETFRGTIAALVVIGDSSRYAAIVMLYDNGSLRTRRRDRTASPNASRGSVDLTRRSR